MIKENKEWSQTVKEILQEYLTIHGYDGLFNEWEECGCRVDDLMCCDSCPDECEPGYDLGDGMIGRRQ